METNILTKLGLRAPFPKSTRRFTLAFIADIHAGSEKGLCPEGIAILKKGTDGHYYPHVVDLTPEQKALADQYDQDLEGVKEFAAGDPVAVFVVGDVTQGDRFKEELMTAHVASQVGIAVGTLDLWFDRIPNITWMRLATGTPVHEFGTGSAVELVTQYLALKRPDADIRMVDHGLVDLNGFTVDYAHHGPGVGRRKWMEMNNALWGLKDIMTKDLFDQEIPPKLVVRADKHTFGVGSWHYITKQGLIQSTYVALPSYQGLTAHARKVTQSTHKVHHGLVAVEVIDGELGRIKPFVRQYDLRAREIWRYE